MNATEEQAAAITAEGRIQVLAAGAGSGKTKTLVDKVRRDQTTEPCAGKAARRQVVITFTNAAAGEVRDRLKKKGAVDPWFVGTLHAFALKNVGASLGNPRMISDREFDRLIADVFEANGIKGISIRKARELAAGDGSGLLGKNRAARAAVVAKMNEGSLLHPDLILGHFLKRIDDLPLGHGLKLYVDEFQDTASIDSAIYRAIIDAWEASIFAVGDPRQAIFGFRGATSAEFSRLWDAADWRGELTGNFRSLPEIVTFANGVASRMTLPPGLEGRMKHVRETPKGEIAIARADFTTCEEEAAEIAKFASSVERSPEGPGALEDLAILTRYNASVQMIADVLRAHDFRVNSSLDRAEAAAFLQDDETVRRVICLRRIPEDWNAALIALDAPRDVRDKLIPILSDVERVEDLPFAIREGILRREADAVTVTTVHAAKGLEWPKVWIAGADSKSFDPDKSEDVRLAYVAATRAEDLLVISHAKSRIGFRREVDLTPSPILF